MENRIAVRLAGTALHRGGPAEVVLTRRAGPITFAQRGAERARASLSPVRTDRGVTVASADGAVRVDLVEHLFAAIGGLGVCDGLLITTDDDELPLLDGGAARFTEALLTLDLPRARRLRVTRAGSFDLDRSRYTFAPGPAVDVRVTIDFPAPVGRQSAAWSGDAADFIARIAPARTFGWTRELDALRAAGRAASVDPASVLIFDGDRLHAACSAAGDDEPARHKLLDLVGDLALHGGPPIGSIAAHAPGHGASHAVVVRALAEGVLAEVPA